MTVQTDNIYIVNLVLKEFFREDFIIYNRWLT